MLGFTFQQVQGVAKQRQDSPQRSHSTPGASREIEDQGGADGSAQAASQGGKRSLPAAFGAHHLGDAVEQAVADGPGGLGGHIAGADAGAAGGDHQPSSGGCRTQCVFNGWTIVWY